MKLQQRRCGCDSRFRERATTQRIEGTMVVAEGPTTDEVLSNLQREGYHCARIGREASGAVNFIVDTARCLGTLYVPEECDPQEPVIRTSPTRTKRVAPFDRGVAIGWHGDFATHEDRPDLSVVYITRPDPRGGRFGAWRLASVARVLEVLGANKNGRTAVEVLRCEPLPFRYGNDQGTRWFRVLELRKGRLGFRYYLPSIRRGCLAEYGKVPSRIESALAAVEDAADQVATVVLTREGSLLITSNWFALHDRMRQTVSRTRPLREALLCFVATAGGSRRK